MRVSSQGHFLVLVILAGSSQIGQVKLQLLAAVGAEDLAGFQSHLVENDLLLADGAGGLKVPIWQIPFI